MIILIKQKVKSKQNKVYQQQIKLTIVMSKKTQSSEVATNFTEKEEEGSSSSYMINKKRQMFQSYNERSDEGVKPKHIIQQNGSKLIPKNVLLMNPTNIKSVVWPQVFMPDQQLYVTLKGNFYSIKDSRNKQKFINRNSMPNSQIMYFNVEKNGQKLIMTSVQKFLIKNQSHSDELWYHFDVALFNIQTQTITNFSSVQKGFTQASSTKTVTKLKEKNNEVYNLQFKGIQMIDNYKKAFVVFEPVGIQKNRYEVILIDFQTKKSSQKDVISSSATSIKMSKKLGAWNFQSLKVGGVQMQRKQSENYIKLINSEYGDIVLLVTSHQIYEIQIAGQLQHNEYTLVLKPFMVCKIFRENKNTYVSNQTNQLILTKQMFSKEQTLIDAQYVMSGLKIMILTSHGRIFVVQSEQCIFSQSLYEMLSSKEMVQNYNIEYFVFKTIYFLRGLLVIQVQSQKKSQCNLLRQIKYEQSILDKLDERKNLFEYVSRGLIIAKVQSNSLSFSKFISLPFDLKKFNFIKIHPFKETDELLIQVISDKQPEQLQLHRCQIISNKNNFIPFSYENYIKEGAVSAQDSKISQTKLSQSKSKVSFGKSHKIFYVLKGNQVTGYRIYTNEFKSFVKNGIQKTLTVSFFQKPQKIITNPLTGEVVILFRQFIKFFVNTYSELKLINVMSVRNANDISFSRYGQHILMCMNDNTIHLLDSYTLTEKKVLDFYGEIKEAHYRSDYILSVKTSKNMLNIFRKKQIPTIATTSKGVTQDLQYFDKLYDLKIDSEDLYFVDQTQTIVLKKDGCVEFYSHAAQDRSHKQHADEKQIIRLNLLLKEHKHLINRKRLEMERGQIPVYIFFSSQFSTLFVGTNYGNVKQYLYPFLSIQDPSFPECYTYSASNQPIIHIQVNADFSSLYVVTELGQVIDIKFTQYLNGIMKNGIYVLSKTQPSQNQVKYEFANRGYLIDDFTPINQELMSSINEQYEQTCFVDDKIKNDIEDVTTKIKAQSSKAINKLTFEKKHIEEAFKSEFGQLSIKLKEEEKIIGSKLQHMKESNQKAKQQIIDKHQKQLLQIYRQNDRLNGIMNLKSKEYSEETMNLKEQLSATLSQHVRIKQEQLARLESQFQKVNSEYSAFKNIKGREISQHSIELLKLKNYEVGKVQDELKQQELKKEAFLSQMGKTQKEIDRYKKRLIYFENLIVQTNNQIKQLSSDIVEYDDKKSHLIKQLKQKEQIIENKQTLIVKYLKTTNQMKKIKNVHEFQLEEFEKEVSPIEGKIKQLQKQVQKMNSQIMNQFNDKLKQDELIANSNRRILKLKQKQKDLLQDALQTRTSLIRFVEALNSILDQDPFALDVKKRLSKVIDAFSKNNEVFVSNQELQKAKKLGLDLVRKKTMLNKAIERQQKIQEGIHRNKNQFFRFYADNTHLVKEYNQLFRDHNSLMREKNILQQKIKAIKAEMFKTPLKKSASLHIRKISEKKLTPFQRYQQEQTELNSLKQKDTVQTRASRVESTSFLKSLIKDVGQTQNTFQKSHLIRDRIRTFVNPQIQRKKDIQKQLFQKQRERGKSNYVHLLKL